MRASDRDRDRIVGQLRVHSVAGRISHDDLENRLERALSAETVDELAALVSDLPRSRPEAQTSCSARELQLVRPGIRPFILQLVVAQEIERVRALALDTAAVGLVRSGFELTRHTTETVELARASRQGWFRFTHERVVMSFEPRAEAHTVLLIYGRATRKVRKQLARLTDD